MLASSSLPVMGNDVIGDIENISISELRALYQYWCDKKGDRLMPCRADIKPTDIVEILPKVALIDVEKDPRRFRLRLLGTEVVLAIGQEATGKYLDDMIPQEKVLSRLEFLVTHKKGYYVTSQLDWLGRGFQKYHMVCLPLADERGEVNMILCGMQAYFQQ